MKESVLLAHSGKQHSYHVAKSLLELEYLYEFYTSTYFYQPWLQSFFNKTNLKFFSKRFLNGLSGNKIKTNWLLEIPEFILAKTNHNSQKVQEAVFNRDVKFDLNVCKHLNKTKAKIYWGFQGSSLESIKTANKLGLKTICELSTGHVIESIKILSEERNRLPQWADSFDNLDFPESYKQRLMQEPHEADMVFAASSFTKETLIKDGILENKIKVLPLGYDTRYLHYNPNVKIKKRKKLKLLYAGRVTQRKGIHYALEAMKSVKQIAELDIIGFVHGKGEGLKSFDGLYKLLPPLNQHDLFQRYEDYDALILPTLFEGFGLVIVEAMAKGLPVITTTHSIGADIINHNENGYLVNIRDVEGIVSAITSLYDKNEDERAQMSAKARQSSENLSWTTYKQNMESILNDLK